MICIWTIAVDRRWARPLLELALVVAVIGLAGSFWARPGALEATPVPHATPQIFTATPTPVSLASTPTPAPVKRGKPVKSTRTQESNPYAEPVLKPRPGSEKYQEGGNSPFMD